MKPLSLLLLGVVVGWAASGPEAAGEEKKSSAESVAVASSFSGRGVFVSNRNGDCDIYSISGESGETKRLTDTADADVEPCWSPDGKSIAFARFGDDGSEIVIMNSDGTNERPFTNHRAWTSAPSWSPDGNKLAYSLLDNGNWDIFIADLQSDSTTNLTDTQGTDTYPNFSPSGSSIAFHRQEGEEWNVYTIDVDGSNRKQLTQKSGRNWLPVWSPNGEQIAFWSTRTGDWELFVSNADGTDPRQIGEQAGKVRNWISRPAWTPDGGSLVISSHIDKGHSDLVMVSVDGGKTRRIAEMAGDDTDSHWLPDTN